MSTNIASGNTTLAAKITLAGTVVVHVKLISIQNGG